MSYYKRAHGVILVDAGDLAVAVEIAERGATGLVVVPIALNYERKERFRSEQLTARQMLSNSAFMPISWRN